MTVCRNQQIKEMAMQVGTNGLILHRASECRDNELVGGNREVIAPEMNQSFAKRFFTICGNLISRCYLCQISLTNGLACRTELFPGIAFRDVLLLEFTPFFNEVV